MKCTACKIILFLAAFLWLVLLAAMIDGWMGFVWAHDAPSGWSYDVTCCNTLDCRPADGPETKVRHHPVKIEEVTGGYRISTTQEVVPWNDKRIRESKDGDYHVCTTNGADSGRALCIYVPMRGV